MRAGRTSRQQAGSEQADGEDDDPDLAWREPDGGHARARGEAQALGLGAGVADHERGDHRRGRRGSAPSVEAGVRSRQDADVDDPLAPAVEDRVHERAEPADACRSPARARRRRGRRRRRRRRGCPASSQAWAPAATAATIAMPKPMSVSALGVRPEPAEARARSARRCRGPGPQSRARRGSRSRGGAPARRPSRVPVETEDRRARGRRTPRRPRDRGVQTVSRPMPAGLHEARRAKPARRASYTSGWPRPTAR